MNFRNEKCLICNVRPGFERIALPGCGALGTEPYMMDRLFFPVFLSRQTFSLRKRRIASMKQRWTFYFSSATPDCLQETAACFTQFQPLVQICLPDETTRLRRVFIYL
ncbi:hypothetical protein CHARACLAT_014865 [Characodon lateralis]|uniref:Uncharacterized protein n=1 Tax=Characodon lateralis TaxID=208331 RepID=A0ABU7E1B1_9TELE|nr:hypothetical protein [Characodon lateralis]